MRSNAWISHLVGMCALVFFMAPASASEARYFLERVELDGYSIPYAVHFPPGMENRRGLPITLFLHGSGEAGSDGIAQTRAGIGPALRDHPERFPTVVVLPQIPIDREWDEDAPIDPKNPRSPTFEALALKALDETMAAYDSDPTRVYLTGVSTGGFGTWKFAARHPERFAAIMPICGGGDPKTMAEPLRDMPIYAFHGLLDFNVRLKESRRMIKAVRAAGNRNVHFVVYPFDFHNSWDDAYSSKKLLKAFFSEKLPHRK